MKKFNIWQGIYSTFNEAPVVGIGYEENGVFSSKVQKFRQEFRGAGQRGSIPEILGYSESLLPFLTGILAREGKTIRILDFGGGFGGTYLKTKSALDPSVKIKYVIIELKKTCQEGKKFFKKAQDLNFLTAIPDKFSAHIVHFGSSIHYIGPWQQLLTDLAKRSPEYFVFTDLTAGDIPTYVTAQYYFGSMIPVWFFNINDFIKQMDMLGYQLLFKSTFKAKILGKCQNLLQDNFEPQYRLKNTCNLAFRKKEVEKIKGGKS